MKKMFLIATALTLCGPLFAADPPPAVPAFATPLPQATPQPVTVPGCAGGQCQPAPLLFPRLRGFR